MAVGFALAVIAAIAVGVPLVALTVVRRLPPPRLRPVRPDPVYDWARRHRLGAPDHLRVEQAVRDGRRVQPERLVPAAREYAELVLGRSRSVRTRKARTPRLHPRTRRLLACAFLIVYLIITYRFFGNGWMIVIVLAVNLASSYSARREFVQTRAAAEQALKANQERVVSDITNGACATNLPLSLG